MGKIRVQDLARSMGVEQQDLVFKLKSIGVRVEGDEALIDTNIIQAILQGKRLPGPGPREVILRDDDAPPLPPVTQRSALRRPTGGRPLRRTMIQRVERPIREIEVRNKAAADERSEAAQDVHPQAQAAVEVKAAPAVVAETPVEAEAPKAKKAAKAAKAAPAKDAAAAPAKKVAAPAKAAPAKAAPAKADDTAAKRAAKPARSEAKPTVPEARPTQPAKEAARPPVDPRRARTPPRPGRPMRPAPRRAGRDPRRGRRPDRPMPRHDDRRLARPAAPEEKPRLPVSARGHRRAQRRKDEPDRTSSGLQFKDVGGRPEGPVTITEGMTVREFAEKLGVKAKDIIRALVMRGSIANINHVLDPETAKSLAEELGVEVMEVSFEEEVQLLHESSLDDSALVKESRAPVVTVMGHVDHGKTTLLDRIRSTEVAEGEAGGITQHIGAYHVDVGDKKVVFLDTPGHEAFTMMRARGAKVTDVVVLVVAADDSVMPQTIEAINHAKAANVPLVVAINKIDKANANLDRVKKELADQGLMVESWGGDVVSVPISALNGEGVEELLEMIALTSDILELKASPSVPAHGAVLEARKEVGRGIVATVLVQDGTLRTGDTFVAGSTWGKVRIMTDDRGERLTEAGPATPVEITGFTEVPAAGDLLQVMDDESKARSIAELRRQEERQRELRPLPARISLEKILGQNQDETKELPIIIKADVDGSVEVLRDSLQKLSTEKVEIKVLHAAVGGISDYDVVLASASNAVILGFNVRPEKSAAAMAEQEGIDIRLHTVIYELQDELKRAMTGLLEPVFKEVQTGTAEVRNTFKVPKIGVVAGAHIVDGHIPRSAQVRLVRDSRVVWEGKIASLKRFKEDVSEVRSGFDCGIGLERFQDIKPGDYIEAFTREEIAPTL